MTRIAKKLVSTLLTLVLLTLSAFPAVRAQAISSYDTSGSFDIYSDELQVVRLVNHNRMIRQLQPLSVLNSLQVACRIRADEASELFEHIRPNQTYFNTVFDEVGLEAFCKRENLAQGQRTPEIVVNDQLQGWMYSPVHCANILAADVYHIGTAVKRDDHTWAQLFAGGGSQTPSCSYSSLSVIPSTLKERYEVGTSLFDSGILLLAYCDVHGACILPLIDEMCDYFNVKQEGIHTVRAHAYGLTAEFQYALGESCSLITPTTEPTTEIPTTEIPTTEPTTEIPTTEAPTTEAPTTEPVTEVPTTRYDQGDIDWDNMYNDYSQYFPDESTKAPSTTKKSNGQFDFTLDFDVSVESPSNATRPSAVTESSTAKPSDSSTGVFYISNKNYKVNKSANIIYQVEEKNTVEDFLKFFSGAEFCVIDNKGNVCIASDIVATGDKLNLLNPDGSTAVEYEISVLMDVDCNGKISAADARMVLRVSATLDRVEGARFKAADVDGNGAIKANDARTTLRRAAGL